MWSYHVFWKGSMQSLCISKRKGPGWLNELGSKKVVELPNNSYKPITDTAWVRARLCKLQKKVHSTHSRK